MSERKHPHRAGQFDWITFLATAPEPNLEAWHADNFIVDIFDRRGQTLRCRAIDGGDRGVKIYERAAATAKEHDVTIQDLVGAGDSETYPVVNLGSHEMKWPPQKGKRR